MNEYEQKIEARRERFLRLADQAERLSAAANKRARDMASVIPFGQPILVGHHSERRDRNYRERIGRTFDRAYALSKKAEYFRSKAASVGGGGISSDDPSAVDKLREKLAKLEHDQEIMRKANGLVRKKDRAGLAALGFSETRINQLFEPDFCGRIGFPDYALKNNNANIRRIRERIAQLEQRPTEDTESQHGEITLREDATEGRVMLMFPGKPSDQVRGILKASGFKWSPNRGAWVRMLNNAGRAAAQYALQQIAKVTA